MRRALAGMLALPVAAPAAAVRPMTVPRYDGPPHAGESLQRAALRVLCEPDVARKARQAPCKTGLLKAWLMHAVACCLAATCRSTANMC